MNRIAKKIITPFEVAKPTGAILLINLVDPQLPVIKVFLKAILDWNIRYWAVGNKSDLVSEKQIDNIKKEFTRVMGELNSGIHSIHSIISIKEEQGLEELKELIDKKFKSDERVIVLGNCNSGKSSLISKLINKPLEIGDILGTTTTFGEYPYKNIILIDSIGQLIDINKPLMFSLDLSDCTTIEDRIDKIFLLETTAISRSLDTAKESIIKAVNLLKKQIDEGKKIIVVGAGASALVSKEAAGQGTEIGLPIMVFTNDLSEAQPISFAKGIAEDEMGLARYISLVINPGDCLIGISVSGSTGFVYNSLRLAKEKGAYTISITENIDTPIGKYSDIIIKSNCKPEGVSASATMTTHLVITHCINLCLGEEKMLTANECLKYMLPERCATKLMGIK